MTTLSLMVDHESIPTKIRKRSVPHHPVHNTPIGISSKRNKNLPTLPLVKHQARSNRTTTKLCWLKTFLMIGLFSFLSLTITIMVFHEHMELSWKTRRKLKKSILSIRSSIPLFIRNPLLSFRIVLCSPEEFRIHTEWHPRHRNERFPTIEERVQLYMSNWYNIPCRHDDNATKARSNATIVERFTTYNKSDVKEEEGVTTTSWQIGLSSSRTQPSVSMLVNTTMVHNKLVLLDEVLVDKCAHPLSSRKTTTQQQQHHRIDVRQSYCQDVVGMIQTRNRIVMESDPDNNNDLEVPLIVIFGDVIQDAFQGNILSLPVFTKYRSATTRNNLKAVVSSSSYVDKVGCLDNPRKPLQTTSSMSSSKASALSPIIWKLNSERHWAPLDEAKRKDIPWKLKKQMAVWRGVLTGTFDDDPKKNIQRNSLEKCRSSVRCNFVLQHTNSHVMDVGLTDLLDNSGIDPIVQGKPLVKGLMSLEELQQYKIMISIEGNDVSSGLKWQLLSKSVVIMSPPTLTSWAMEELLKPWVHYVPMYHNGSNAEEMVQWVLDHDEEAQKIAERATLFMEDMVYHPDAAADENMIKEDIIRRYVTLWTPSKFHQRIKDV